MDKLPQITNSGSTQNLVIPEHEAELGAKDGYVTLLPILFADSKHNLLLPTDDLKAFLRQDLSVERLTNIHGWLWMVGRPQAARSLQAKAKWLQ